MTLLPDAFGVRERLREDVAKLVVEKLSWDVAFLEDLTTCKT
tara:strand:+ start:296 stop:421 length:126 start_codon:yes stop_codon:yes gene_type:complete